jgi:large subunit ribosomal protein L28
VQALAQNLELIDQLAAMAHGAEQPLERRRVRWPTQPLAQQPDERGAVAIVRLEAARAELGARRLRLRRGQQPDAARESALELDGPGPVQRPGRLDPDQQLARQPAAREQALKLVDPLAKRRQRDRLADQASLAGRKPHAVTDLGRIDGDEQRVESDRLLKLTGHLQPPSSKKREKDNDPSRTGRASSTGLLVTYQLHSAAVSKVCAVCGKKPSFGNHRSHSMVATKRRFEPNLQRVRVLLDGKATRAYVCTRCLKKSPPTVQKLPPRGSRGSAPS